MIPLAKITRTAWICALLLIPVACYAQSVAIVTPAERALFQQNSGTADVHARVTAGGLPSGGGVEFVIDMGLPGQRSTQMLAAQVYECIFTAVPAGEHTLDAFVIDSGGIRQSAKDHRDRIGVGDIIVAIGDSITAGEEDDISTDNWSSDGRVGPYVDPNSGYAYGGFEPILSDRLTARKGYPVMVVNRGVPGSTTLDGTASVAGAVAANPTAKTWLVAYGTNDSNTGYSAAQYKANLLSIIQTIQAAIPGAAIYVPKVFYWTKPVVQDYHSAIGDITRSTPNVYWGADLETLFKSNHARFDHLSGAPGTWLATDTTHHPNGTGIQKMAWLWEMALMDRVVLASDGYYPSVGTVAADGVFISEINRIGLSQDNLLLVQAPFAPIPPPPPGVVFPAKDRAFRLGLTGTDSFNGGYVKMTLLADKGMLDSSGAASWNQMWVAKDDWILTCSRNVSALDGTSREMTATVRSPGQVTIAADITPPVTSIATQPAQPGTDGWFASAPKITLSATDSALRPVTITRFHWDSNADSAYTGTLTAPSGVHTLYYYSVDESGNVEATKSMLIQVKGAPSTPTCVSLTPSSGTLPLNTPMTLQSVYTDANGFADIELAYLMLNPQPTATNYVYVKYDAGDNVLYLRNNQGTAWLDGYAPGSANVIENSYCKLYCADTTIAGSGANLTVSWRIEFKPTMAGKALPALEWVQDNAGLKSPWMTMGHLAF